ncbi:MAG TPA: hypothetical protein VGJ20_15265 [Xanthobacteraceae bacterium]|jgi:hypothetical protein
MMLSSLRGIEHNQLAAVKHVALWNRIKHLLEPLHPVAVARDQPTADGVGRGASVELRLEDPVGVVKRFRALDGINRHRSIAQQSRYRDAPA